MKRVIKKTETAKCGKTYVRYICPNCGNTLLISDEKAPVEMPANCGHCGAKIEEVED